MKITSFNPLIVTRDADTAIALFEAMGFEKRHNKVSGVSDDINTTRMRDASGFHVDVTKIEMLKQDMMIIRMNVDDLDEACQVFTSHGFTAGDTVVTPTSRSVLMTSKTGFAIDVVKHIAKEDH